MESEVDIPELLIPEGSPRKYRENCPPLGPGHLLGSTVDSCPHARPRAFLQHLCLTTVAFLHFLPSWTCTAPAEARASGLPSPGIPLQADRSVPSLGSPKSLCSSPWWDSLCWRQSLLDSEFLWGQEARLFPGRIISCASYSIRLITHSAQNTLSGDRWPLPQHARASVPRAVSSRHLPGPRGHSPCLQPHVCAGA